jgi:pimeloyl-ACP methyl ester carboxylesterase
VGPRSWADAVAWANAAAKQPVLFIHDPRLASRIWEPWTEALDDAGYLTVMLSLPADSAVDPGDDGAWLVERATKYFAEIIQGLSSRPAVVGLARGGVVARRLAEERLSAATVVIAPEPHPAADDGREALSVGSNAALLTIPFIRDDTGWRAAAQTALTFIQRFV